MRLESRSPEPLALRTNIDAVLKEKLQTALGKMAVEPHTVSVICTIVNLGVLCKVSQHAAVGNTGFDFRFKIALAER